MFQVGAMLPEPRAVRRILEFAEHAGFRDRVVRMPAERGADAALEHVDAIAGHQQQPMRGLRFTEGVREAANGARQPTQWLPRAEDRRQELVLSRLLTRLQLRLTLGELPVRPCLLEFLLRVRRTIGGIEIDTPPGNRAPKLLGVRRGARLLSCV